MKVQKANPTRNRNLNNELPTSTSKIKKRIRDVKRTLNKKKDLSAEAMIAAKRSLRALEFELGEKIVDEHERSNATKYHKVKHFERKKTERKIKQAKRDVESAQDPAKKAAAQEKLDDLELKLLYVTHYPKTIPYVSLYPTENADDVKSVSRKNRVLNDMKQALLAGDKDLTLLLRKYRNEYKQKLIKRGDIPPEAPVDDEEIKSKEVNEDKKEAAEAEGDDFFEV